jgi:hypothetical protein
MNELRYAERLLDFKNNWSEELKSSKTPLIGTASLPDRQKFRIIGFLFENRLHWQSEAEKIYKWIFRPHIYLCTNKIILICI